MLSERRHRIFSRALFIEMTELWGFAQQPAHRLPEMVVLERMRDYYRCQLRQALVTDDREPLAEVLAEILLIATGQDEVAGWSPPVLACGAELRLPL